MLRTTTDICNSALSFLGEETLLNVETDTGRAARFFRLRYPFTRDACFRAHPWGCLKKRASLAPDANNVPAFGPANAFRFPQDLVRQFKVADIGVKFVVEGQFILSNSNPLNILYIAQIADPSYWDSLLFEAVVQRMAADLSIPIKGSEESFKLMWQAYIEKLREARHINAQESEDQPVLQGSSWLDARMGGPIPTGWDG